MSRAAVAWRRLLPLALATGLAFLASLVTGWHYAVDGYAGLALAWLAVTLADRCEPLAPRARAHEEGPRPTAADGGPDEARVVAGSGASSTP